MINGLEGIPGSGKSYEACTYHVLPALQAGRKVITNLPLDIDYLTSIDPAYRDLIEVRIRPQPIRGTWDATRIDDQGNGHAIELFSDGETKQPGEGVVLFGHLWDFYSTWKHPKTGQGPLFIVDECHVAFPKIGTDKQVIEWFKLHRHFNADVLLCTQNFRDCNDSVRTLMAVLVKVRKADILGKADHYIRKVHGGYRGGLLSTEQRKYKKENFKLYRSHTQGNSVGEAAATDVAPFIVKFKRFTWAFWVLALVYAVYAFWPSAPKPKHVKDMGTVDVSGWAKPAPQSVQPGEAKVDQPQAVRPLPEPSGQSVEVAPDEVPEPFGQKVLHLTGVMSMSGKNITTFAISVAGKRIGAVSNAELASMGYRWEPLTECAGTLRWKNTARAVTCDAPDSGVGSEGRPVVLAVPAGSSTPTASSRGLPTGPLM